jgi:hypothetical protein
MFQVILYAGIIAGHDRRFGRRSTGLRHTFGCLLGRSFFYD